MAKFLVVRSDDLVALGVSLHGFNYYADGNSNSDFVVAASASARLVVVFPPQHIGEQAETSDGAVESIRLSAGETVPVWAAVLAGPSRVTCRVPAGTWVGLTTEGILDALADAELIAPEQLPGPTDTELELPWHLRVCPVGADWTPTHPGRAVACAHPAEPVYSRSGAAGLWRTRILPAPGGKGIALRVFGSPEDAADPGFGLPLGLANRNTIRAAALTAPASTRRLELSTLGASLSVAGVWPGVTWRHEAALGRDMSVEVVREGVLYPFGHRAVFTELTERRAEPSESGQVAALRTVGTIVVAEPDRDLGEHTAFPFRHVSFPSTVFTVDDPSKGSGWKMLSSPAQETVASLQHQYDQASHRLADAEAALKAYMISCGWHESPDLDHLFEDECYSPRYHGVAQDKCRAVLEVVQELAGKLAEANFWENQAPIPACFAVRANGQPLLFPVRLGAANPIDVRTPLVFVVDLTVGPLSTLGNGRVDALAKQAFQDIKGGEMDLPAVSVNLVPSSDPLPGDTHEVHGLTIEGSMAGNGFEPRLTSFRARLPALARLRPDKFRGPVSLTFTDDYLVHGDSVDVAFRPTSDTGALDIDLTDHADRSGGLVGVKIVADGLSRRHGPVQAEGAALAGAAAAAAIDPAKLFSPDATVLGFPLADLLSELDAPPSIIASVDDMGLPGSRLVFPTVKMKDFPPFQAGEGSELSLNVEMSPEKTDISCTMRDFSLVLPPGADADQSLIRLDFGSLTYQQRNGTAPTVNVEGMKTTLLGALRLLKDLESFINPSGDGPGGVSTPVPQVTVSETEIVARWFQPIPSVPAGAFILSGLEFRSAVLVPFDGRPVSIEFGLSSCQKPFNLSVLMFGGGGYVDLVIDHSGLRSLDAALEFGASMAVDFGVAAGEVHALGGVTFTEGPGGVELTGYLRIGGCVEVLGLVSVSIELMLALTYDFESGRLLGHATMVLAIDLTLYSDTVTIDSGVWSFSGSQPAAHGLAEAGADDFTAWQNYRKAFAE